MARKPTYVTEETRDYTLGRQASNALWVKELYGDDTLSKLSKHPVLCSGYTMGHASPIRDYLRTMDAEVTRLKAGGQVDRLMQRAGHSMGRGFDQGVHNALVRFGWLANSTTVRVLLLSDGPVLHGNGARNKRQFTFDGTTLWTRPTAKTGLPGAAAVPCGCAPIWQDASHLPAEATEKGAYVPRLGGSTILPECALCGRDVARRES